MADRIGPKKPVHLYLREHRKALGLTLEDVGGRIGENGVSKGTVSRWETEDRKLTLDVIAAYAEAIGKRPEELYIPPPPPMPKSKPTRKMSQVPKRAVA